MATRSPIPSLPPRIVPDPGKGKFEAQTHDGFAKAKAFARFMRDLPAGKFRAEQVQFAMAEFGLSRASLFRYKKEFEQSPSLSSVLDRSNRKRSTEKRLVTQAETIVAKVTKRYWREQPQGNFKDLTVEVNKALVSIGVMVSVSTVWRRFNERSQSERHSIRHNAKDAQARYGRIKGKTPEQEYPLGRVQVDSTMCDIWLIHPVTGAAIGRAWVTFVLDECTRCILGYFVTLEAPSAASVAFALHHAVMPKEDWLADLDVRGEWPCSGIPNWLYTDNGSEFKKAFQAGCEEWLIDYDYRPVARPRWGGQIERVIGTFMKQMRLLPGAVIKKTEAADRRGYDPAKHATLTLEKLNRHLAMMVVAYHNKKHSALGVTPLQKWKKAFARGGKEFPKPILRVDEPTKFLIDFLPVVHPAPTLQRYGLRIKGLEYSDESLSHFDDMDISTKLLVRRNPHDLSKVYVYHPDQRFYVEVCCTDADAPTTEWELRRAKEFNKQAGIPNSVEALAQAAAINQLQEDVDLHRSQNKRRAHRNNARSTHSKQLAIPPGKPVVVPEADEARPCQPRAPFIPPSYDVEVF